MATTQRSGDWAEESARAVPDPSWKRFYRIGGVSAFLYVILGIIVPTVMVLSVGYFGFDTDGEVLLEYIAAHQIWWLALQTMVLGSSILAVVVFMALFLALKHLDKSTAALGAAVAVVCQILFVAYYPVLLGTVYLSERYAEADEAYRTVILSAFEALMAQNNAFNPLYESVFAASILILSIVMLRGVFHRGVAYLGIAIAPAALIALALWPIVGVGYFWWWLLFVIWFSAVGWKLFRLGGE